MVIVWNEAKRRLNLEKHGLDFADAQLVHYAPDKITLESRRSGEVRLVDLANVELAGTVLVVVYRKRGREVRVISFRRASRKERKIYEHAHKE